MCLVHVGCTGHKDARYAIFIVLVKTPIIFETYTDPHKKDAVVLGYYWTKLKVKVHDIKPVADLAK